MRGTRGIHTPEEDSLNHKDWLPFTVRFYFYAGSEAIRTIHTIVYDGDAKTDFISGLGLRFDVPLAGEELFNRHVRIAGVDGGMLHEAVQGLTGLRRDPGAKVRSAQAGYLKNVRNPASANANVDAVYYISGGSSTTTSATTVPTTSASITQVTTSPSTTAGVSTTTAT